MSLGTEFTHHLLELADEPVPPEEWNKRSYVELYDTTLRDGTQGEQVSFSVADKLKITRLLDQLGVAYVEGGWPGSNPKDAEYFAKLRLTPLETTKVTAFGMTCRVGSRPEEDASIQALLEAEVPVVTIVGKTSPMHVRDVLRTTPEENLRLIHDTLAYLKKQNLEVIYDAEHFFDGYKLDPEYAMETLAKAAEAGADCLVLCDTNGGSMPWEVHEMVAKVVAAFPACRVGIHTHNDGAMAAANSIEAVRAGASQVQGTINGYGERCGNVDLCSVAPTLELKMDYRCLPSGSLRKLTKLSRTVAELANLAPRKSAPYVGRSAFAHKGGMHGHAMRLNQYSYQHIDPVLVGNKTRILVSDLAGRGNMMSKAEELSVKLDPNEASELVQEIKRLEHDGYVFEGADASVTMLMRRRQAEYQPPFDLVDFKVVVEDRLGQGITAEATVKVKVNDEVIHTVAEGTGPVDALDTALRKALVPLFPQLGKFRLADYKVRILDGDKGPAATTRVLVDSQNGKRRWTTVGASRNIIEASYKALKDSFEFGILEVGYESPALSASR